MYPYWGVSLYSPFFTFLCMRSYIGSVAIGFFLRPVHLHMKFTHVSTNDHLVVSEILTKNVLMSV